MRMSRMWLCGVPQSRCTGGNVVTSEGLGKITKKAHSSPHEAFRCHARYLVKELGYVQIGSREFRLGDGPILVLTKKSRFGAELRPGKLGRWMPAKRNSGAIIG